MHLPYKGGAPAVQALLAGEVQLTAVSVNTSLPQVQSGKARALGVASSKRSPALPDVPTFKESGVDFEGDSWLAIVGPPGLPPDIAAKLNQIFAAALRDPDTEARLGKIGLQVVASSQDELTKVLQRDVPKWGAAVKASGAVARLVEMPDRTRWPRDEHNLVKKVPLPRCALSHIWHPGKGPQYRPRAK